jgi:hypothetical protein
VRRLSLFVVSVRASMAVNELDDLSRARTSQSTHLLDLIDDRRFAETIYRVALADGIMDRVKLPGPA